MSLNKRRKRAIMKSRKKMAAHYRKIISGHFLAVGQGLAEGLSIVGNAFSAVVTMADEAAKSMKEAFNNGKIHDSEQ